MTERGIILFYAYLKIHLSIMYTSIHMHTYIHAYTYVNEVIPLVIMLLGKRRRRKNTKEV